VLSGMLRGRPFGGVMTLINKNLRKILQQFIVMSVLLLLKYLLFVY